MRAGLAMREAARRLPAAEGGVAAVEFALILPLLLLLYLGAIELTTAFTVDRRVLTATGAVGDLVARVNPASAPLGNAELTDYFEAAETILGPYGADELRQVVTLYAITATGTVSFLWSCPYNGAAARTAGSSVLPQTDPIVEAAKGRWVVAAESAYRHRALFSNIPILGNAFAEGFDLYHVLYYVPRYGQLIAKPC